MDIKHSTTIKLSPICLIPYLHVIIDLPFLHLNETRINRYFRLTKTKSPPSCPAKRMSEYWGVWGALTMTGRRILTKRDVPSIKPLLSFNTLIKAVANTECFVPPLSTTGSFPPDVKTVRERFCAIRTNQYYCLYGWCLFCRSLYRVTLWHESPFMSITFTISSWKKIIEEEREGGVIPIATAGTAMRSIRNCFLWMPFRRLSG